MNEYDELKEIKTFKLGERVYFKNNYNKIERGIVACITLNRTKDDWFDCDKSESPYDTIWIFKPNNNRSDITQLIENFSANDLFKTKNELIDFMITELQEMKNE